MRGYDLAAALVNSTSRSTAEGYCSESGCMLGPVHNRGVFSNPFRGADPNQVRKKLTEQLTMYRCILSDEEQRPNINRKEPRASDRFPGAEA
jgi:hypothetical protein